MILSSANQRDLVNRCFAGGFMLLLNTQNAQFKCEGHNSLYTKDPPVYILQHGPSLNTSSLSLVPIKYKLTNLAKHIKSMRSERLACIVSLVNTQNEDMLQPMLVQAEIYERHSYKCNTICASC